MAWKFHSRSPVYLQIASHIRADILNGKYPSEEQIPSVRVLAMEAGVNPNTMQRALGELESEGLLLARGTVGRFVTGERAVLQKTRKRVQEDAMRALVEEALALGVTKEELIEFIQKEGFLCL